MLVIIEGIDGTGKTLLAKQLAAELNIPLADKLVGPGGPRDFDGLVKMTVEIIEGCEYLRSIGKPINKIYDRFPLLSEPIYGLQFRGYNHFGANYPGLLRRFYQLKPFIVYCRPPRECILENLKKSRAYQMEGVFDHWGDLLNKYDYAFENIWPQGGEESRIILHNYLFMQGKEVAYLINQTIKGDEKMDKLEAIFNQQRELMSKFHQIEQDNGLLPDLGIPVNLQTHQGQAVLKSRAWNVVEELGEAMNELKNRPWKQKTYPVNQSRYLEELSDALHFFIELCILSGITAQELYDLYMHKAGVNKTRQDLGA